MPKCIYCEKEDSEVTFLGREHVIPQFFGTFDGNSPVIGKGFVCDDCNSLVFCPLEQRFKEDTEEGIYYQMFNLRNNYQITIRGKSVKMSFSSGLGDDFFNDIFPFFQYQDNDWKIIHLPQIKIRRKDHDSYIILLIDRLKELGSQKFSELRKVLEGVQSKDICIFTYGDNALDVDSQQEAIEILKRLGIKYKISKTKFAPINQKQQFEVLMDCTIEEDASRVISKIAFNYFSYCAIKDNRKDILFHPNFSKIKSHIIGEAILPVKQVIIKSPSDEPIIFDEKRDNIRFIGHTITFNEENDKLISVVSFFGRRVYTVDFGPIPDELQEMGFGCGHIFDPVNNQIHQLTQDSNKWGSDLKIGFGLFKRL